MAIWAWEKMLDGVNGYPSDFSFKMLCHLETEMGTLGVQEMLAHQPGLAKLKTATAPLCPARNPQMQFFSFSHISFFSLEFLQTPSKVG